MSDLDDLDLRPRNQGPDEFDDDFEPAAEVATRPAASGIHPAIPVAALGMVLIGLYAVFRSAAPVSPKAPTATPANPVATVTPAPTPALAQIELPALNASDAIVRGWIAALSANRDFARWLFPDQLIRRFVAAVDNIAEDEDPLAHIRHLAPPARFQAMGPTNALVADPRGFRRFDAFASVAASIDATAAARLCLNLGPLFDDAYAELGHSKGEFNLTLVRALGRLLATPVPPRRFDLIRDKLSFAFADPQLEALAPAQKMMIRLGADNRAKVQAKLEEFRAALEAMRRAN